LATLDRAEKLRLSAETGVVYGFRQGLFLKIMEQSLWRFVHLVRPLKPMLERVKGGGPIVYGGLPIKSFEAMLAENKLAGVEEMEYGWRWPVDDDAITPGYEEWRAGTIAGSNNAAPPGRNVIGELMELNLGHHTPMEVMNRVMDWQIYLRNREGAG